MGDTGRCTTTTTMSPGNTTAPSIATGCCSRPGPRL